MKRIKTILAAVASMIALASCEQEIADFTTRLDDLESRVSKLEQLCSEMNTNISSLQSIVTAMQSGDYITSVKEISEGGKTIGYTITFAKGDPITIYHGQDGADGKDGQDGVDGKDGANGQDGHTPVIGVKQDTDGIWYWTIDGEWLLDANNQKVKAVGVDGKDGADGKDGQDGADGKDGQDGTNGQDGQDGITPQLKIEDGYWYVSTDNGQTWTQLGKATGENGQDGQDGADGKDGECIFQSVTVTDTDVTFVTSDGQTFVLPRATVTASNIQSLTYIPRYTDGASTMWITVLADGTLEARDTLDFRVSPADCVDALVAAWQNVLSVEAVTVVTRAPSDEAITIPIVSVSGANGKLTVVLDGFSLIPVVTSDLSYLSQLRASLIISDGNNERTSEYLEIVPVWKEILAPYAIDLGLSVKWAMCNVGATAIEGCGDYFAWGETETKENYSWETYKWCNESENALTKYNINSDNGFVDNKTVLDMEDDVAHVRLGGHWRMPTDAEWTELREKCILSWTSKQGVSGIEVKGPNGNSIFLPAAGHRYNTELRSAGSSGSYWSSSLLTDRIDDSIPFEFFFNSTDVYMSATKRLSGFPVRPVLGEIIDVTDITLNKNDLSLDMGSTEQLSASVVPSNVTYPVYWCSSNPAIAKVTQDGLITALTHGETTITVYSSDGLHSAKCSVTVQMPAVDLGLSVKWASFDLGAKSTTSYGNMYAWGETEIKEKFGWSTYKFGSSSSGPFSKYNTDESYGAVDNKTILDPEDDVAAKTLGGNWRIPTNAEWAELMENCTWTWTSSDYSNGYLISASNGNSIFLPYRHELLGFWSSSLDSVNPSRAIFMNILKSSFGLDYDERAWNQYIRPVSK